MSEEFGNEFANGANGRFDGLDLLYKAGGQPRLYGEAVGLALAHLGTYFGPEPQPNPDTLTTLEVIREMHALRGAKDAADLIAKELGRRFDYLRLALVPERFDAEGLKNIKIEGIGRVGLRGDIYASIKPGMQDEAFQWLDDNGRGDLVKKTVNSSSLKATLKKYMEEGEDIPENLFKAEPYTMATITKA